MSGGRPIAHHSFAKSLCPIVLHPIMPSTSISISDNGQASSLTAWAEISQGVDALCPSDVHFADRVRGLTLNSEQQPIARLLMEYRDAARKMPLRAALGAAQDPAPEPSKCYPSHVLSLGAAICLVAMSITCHAWPSMRAGWTALLVFGSALLCALLGLLWRAGVQPDAYLRSAFFAFDMTAWAIVCGRCCAFYWPPQLAPVEELLLQMVIVGAAGLGLASQSVSCLAWADGNPQQLGFLKCLLWALLATVVGAMLLTLLLVRTLSLAGVGPPASAPLAHPNWQVFLPPAAAGPGGTQIR